MKKLFTLTKEEFIERSMKGEVFIHEVTGNKFFYDKSKDNPFRFKNNQLLTAWGLFDKNDELFRSEKQKVTIEKWLCKNNQGDFVTTETSDIDGNGYLEKVKLLDTYEVEL